MKTYIGAKIISAEPMTRLAFQVRWGRGKMNITEKDVDGYHVVDDHHRWVPKEEFERLYRLVLDGEREPDMSPHDLDAPVVGPDEGGDTPVEMGMVDPPDTIIG